MGTSSKQFQKSAISIDLEDILQLLSSGHLFKLVQASAPSNAENRADIICQQLQKQLNSLAVQPHEYLVQFISPKESPITIDEIEHITSLLSESINGQLTWGAASANNNEVTVLLILAIS